MTKDRAKVICRHLLFAQQLLRDSGPASEPYLLRLGSLHDSLNPDSARSVGDIAASFAELQQIITGLGTLKAPQPVSAPTLLPGVRDALDQLDKAGTLLADWLKGP
jgi:hypothetical protein